MALRMWMYDLAREQSPTLDHLRRFCDISLEAGYNAIGFNLEHRYAYPSTPWSHGTGAVTPEMFDMLQREYRSLEIIPFINLLGHFEGFLYTETGRQFSEMLFRGMQACPSQEGFRELATKIIDNTLEVFSSSIIHVGGDETQHLGACPVCKARVSTYESKIGVDGKAKLFADHFAPLIKHVMDAGRRPAIWGDMLQEHPQASSAIPKETLIFDWQYFQSASQSAQLFRSQGFDVVYCPTLHVYNATWMHLPQSERNVRENAISAQVDSAFGVCLTTWEGALFANYETLIPAIKASGEIMVRSAEFAEQEEVTRKVKATSLLRITSSVPTSIELNEEFQVSAGLADGIISGLMDKCASEVILTPGVRHIIVSTRVGNDVRETIRIPIDPGHAVLNRISLVANLDPEKRTERRTGLITGTYKDVPFEVTVVSEPTGHGLRISLSMEPWISTTAYAAERNADIFLKAYLKEGETYEEWARLMGVELPLVGGGFEFSGIRSGYKCRMLLYSNPFLLWLRHRDELCGQIGEDALSLFERGITFAPDASARGVSDFGKGIVQFVRFAEEAHHTYELGQPGAAATALNPCRQIFENLTKIARSNHLRIGGSLADIERCLAAKEHIEKVMRRIKLYGDGSLGYVPSFEMITHPNFVPHDQGAWWLINSWARE